MKNRLKEVRRKLKLSQKEVAEMLEINHTTYNRYENGFIEPGMKKLRKLAEIFNVSISYLIMHDATVKIEKDLAPELANIVEKYQQLDIRGKHAVYAELVREFESSNLTDNIKED